MLIISCRFGFPPGMVPPTQLGVAPMNNGATGAKSKATTRSSTKRKTTKAGRKKKLAATGGTVMYCSFIDTQNNTIK